MNTKYQAWINGAIAIVLMAFAYAIYIHGGQTLAEALAVLVANHYFLSAATNGQNATLSGVISQLLPNIGSSKVTSNTANATAASTKTTTPYTGSGS